MSRCFRLFLFLTLLLGSTVLTATAQEATPDTTAAGGDSLLAELGYPELRVTTDGTAHDVPSEIEAGRYHVVFENTSEFQIDLEFVQLPEGITPDDVDAGFAEAEASPVFVPPDFFFDMTWNGGPWTDPGETRGVVLDLTPGEWYLALSNYDPETGEEVASEEIMLNVTGEMPTLDEPEGIPIGLIDMDFVVPDTFEAGPQIWQVRNNGLQVHHLILLGVPDGTTEGDVMELAAMFAAGPPASPEAGASPVAVPALNPEEVTDEFFTLLFSHNQFNLYEVDLQPGTYAMICFMPDPSGTPHVMLGMVQIITVE